MLMTETWPARMVRSAIDALMLPGDVYAGRVDPMSDEGRERAFDLAGVMVGVPTTPSGALGSSLGSRLFVKNAEAMKQRALEMSNRGIGGSNKMLPIKELEARRGGPPEGGERARLEMQYGWQNDRGKALEDYLRAVYPDRYEGFP